MKKLISYILFTLVLGACSPHMYNTYSAGKDNTSYIVVVTGGPAYSSVVVKVDGKDFPIEKLYKEKAMRKVHPILIEPGKHDLQVVADGKTIVNEKVFIGLQETKKIVLK